MMSFLITAVFVIILGSMVINSIAKSVQKVQGKDRCQYCAGRLKFGNDAKYAAVCHRCGRDQPVKRTPSSPPESTSIPDSWR